MEFVKIDYQTALDLKDLGFEDKTRFGYHIDDKNFFDNKFRYKMNVEHWCVSAPDIFHVKKWLLNNYDIHIVSIWDKKSNPHWKYDIYFINDKYNGSNYSPRNFENEDQALIDAIKVAIKTINNKF